MIQGQTGKDRPKRCEDKMFRGQNWLEDKKEKDEWVLDHQTKGLNGLWTSELDIVSGQSNKRPNSRRQTSKGQNGRGRSGNIPLGLRFR